MLVAGICHPVKASGILPSHCPHSCIVFYIPGCLSVVWDGMWWVHYANWRLEINDAASFGMTWYGFGSKAFKRYRISNMVPPFYCLLNILHLYLMARVSLPFPPEPLTIVFLARRSGDRRPSGGHRRHFSTTTSTRKLSSPCLRGTSPTPVIDFFSYFKRPRPPCSRHSQQLRRRHSVVKSWNRQYWMFSSSLASISDILRFDRVHAAFSPTDRLLSLLVL